MKYYNNKLSLLVFMVICLMVIFFTGNGAEDRPANAKEKKIIANIVEAGIQRVEVVGGSNYFDPNYIVVKVNTPVELLVRKDGGFIPHNIIVNAPEAGIDFNVDLDTNKAQVINFTPTKTGTYPMYCDESFLWFDTHREKGMEGVIEVVE